LGKPWRCGGFGWELNHPNNEGIDPWKIGIKTIQKWGFMIYPWKIEN
jgi:hypothetical protein